MLEDKSLDNLLDLHGQIFVLDNDNNFWVKFVAYKVPASKERPHGLSYSLTLHNKTGKRLLGIDNAHSLSDSKHFDHEHEVKKVKPYAYKDAATLLEDFWTKVDNYLKQHGELR